MRDVEELLSLTADHLEESLEQYEVTRDEAKAFLDAGRTVSYVRSVTCLHGVELVIVLRSGDYGKAPT